MPLRAIVFDFDGVLANSEPLHYESYRAVLAEEAIEISESEYYARYLGFDDVGAFRMVAREHQRAWSADYIRDLIARKARYMEQLERDISVLFPGAADVVRRVAEVMPIAIASGALGHEIRRVLDREGLTECFRAIVAAEDTPSSKPAPDPYLRAVALLGAESANPPLSPRDCVAIEDSIWGLESARRAGLRTVAVSQTYPAASLTSADLVIPGIGDVTTERLRALYQDT